MLAALATWAIALKGVAGGARDARHARASEGSRPSASDAPKPSGRGTPEHLGEAS